MDPQQRAEDLWAKATPDAAGLVAAVVVDRKGRDVRMVGYMNREALGETIARGRVVFFSRSKQRLWEKGESSGNVLELRELRIDCDGDAILCMVDAVGPTCHTGARSCFFRREDSDEGRLRFDEGPEPLGASGSASSAPSIFDDVSAVIEARKRGTGSDDQNARSYVRTLLDKGIPKINSKIAEEGAELCAALSRESAQRVANEAADLVFHMLVGLSARDVPLDAVRDVLRARFGQSGLDEKASRKPKAQASPED